MRLPLTKYANTALTIIIVPLTLSPLYPLFLVRLGVYTEFVRLLFLKSKVGHILAKAAALRVNLNIDGAPIVSRSHTHPSHSQTSHLLTSCLCLWVFQYPAQPSVCETYRLVSHYTDTHIYVFSLALALSLHDKQ
jgi:hypothetical protein